MRNVFANSASSRWVADAFELTSSWPSKLLKIRLHAFMLHLPITARIKPSLTQERCLLCPDSEVLEQTSGTSSLVTLTCTVNGRKSSLQHLCNFYPHSVTSFSKLISQTIYVFSYPPCPTSLCGYYRPPWTFQPLINKELKTSFK